MARRMRKMDAAAAQMTTYCDAKYQYPKHAIFHLATHKRIDGRKERLAHVGLDVGEEEDHRHRHGGGTGVAHEQHGEARGQDLALQQQLPRAQLGGKVLDVLPADDGHGRDRHEHQHLDLRRRP